MRLVLALALLAACGEAPRPPPTAPAAPRLAALPEATSRRRLVLSGESDEGTTVRVFASNKCAGAPLLTVSAEELAAGASVLLVDGANVFTARAASRSGLASPCSEPARVRFDRAAPPSAPSGLSVDPAPRSSATHFVVRGTAAAGLTVRVWSGFCVSGTQVASSTAETFSTTGFAFDLEPNEQRRVLFDAVNENDDASPCVSVELTCDREPPHLSLTVRSPNPSPEEEAFLGLIGPFESDIRFGQVFLGDTCVGQPLATCSTPLDCRALRVRFPPATQTARWSALADDLAGNSTACTSAGEAWVVAPGTVPPVSLATLTFGTVSGRVPASADEVELFVDGGCAGEVFDSATSRNFLAFGVSTQGQRTLSARARFGDGGVGECSATWSQQ